MTQITVTLAAVDVQGIRGAALRRRLMGDIRDHGAQPSAHPAHRLEVVLSGLEATDQLQQKMRRQRHLWPILLVVIVGAII